MTHNFGPRIQELRRDISNLLATSFGIIGFRFITQPELGNPRVEYKFKKEIDPRTCQRLRSEIERIIIPNHTYVKRILWNPPDERNTYSAELDLLENPKTWYSQDREHGLLNLLYTKLYSLRSAV